MTGIDIHGFNTSSMALELFRPHGMIDMKVESAIVIIIRSLLVGVAGAAIGFTLGGAAMSAVLALGAAVGVGIHGIANRRHSV